MAQCICGNGLEGSPLPVCICDRKFVFVHEDDDTVRDEVLIGERQFTGRELISQIDFMEGDEPEFEVSLAEMVVGEAKMFRTMLPFADPVFVLRRVE